MAGTLTLTTLSDGTNSTSATNCIQGSAKAWVNFNGATPTITASFNVSSITKGGTGNFLVNFTTAMPDANYSVSGCIGSQGAPSGTANPVLYVFDSSSAPTTSAVRVATIQSTNAAFIDAQRNFVQIFR